MTQETADHHWMQEALQEARVAETKGEVPVGCVIVQDEAIIGRGHNLRESSADPTAHAEVIALRDASQTLRQWRLSQATVYVTLEPCPMCAGALINARVKRVVFGCSDPKAGCCGTLYNLGQDSRFNHRYEVTSGVCAEEAAELLRSFFRQRRKLRRDGRVVEGA